MKTGKGKVSGVVGNAGGAGGSATVRKPLILVLLPYMLVAIVAFGLGGYFELNWRKDLSGAPATADCRP